MTGNHRKQCLGNDILVFCRHEFDLPVFAGEQIPQGAAVDIQKTTEQSGGVRLQEEFDMPVKTLGAVVGK